MYQRVFGITANDVTEKHDSRQEDKDSLQQQVNWLDQIPVKAMIKAGWIQQFEDKVEQLREVLSFFSVASPDQWGNIWSNAPVYFRKSQTFESNFGDVAAWLRRGEIEAAQILCMPYDAKKFKEALEYIRRLTLEPPQIFQSEVVRLCATAGVAVVFVPQLPKTRTCGATRWLTSEKALIQLSLRYKTNDHLWFGFFHEAGHILLHGKRDIFLEGKGSEAAEEQDKETEANKFAEDILIPPAEFKEFLNSGQQRSKAGIEKFASKIGIAPGIVVGRLQHDNFLPKNHCNDLKERFQWTGDET